jgi:murein L,D-transpeptidase YcbB/YkuD
MITHVVVAPNWNVPGSIAHNEIWPNARRDPDYLQRNNMIVTRAGTIRQNPGPTNPLGRVKFKMPNEYAIALHDTPDQSHFEQSRCAFSHGCVRIQNAMKLASLLLSDNPEWSEQKLETVASAWRETEIPLTKPMPVRIAYVTNWLDEAGIVHYGVDFYSRDIPLFEALYAEQNALSERRN